MTRTVSARQRQKPIERDSVRGKPCYLVPARGPGRIVGLGSHTVRYGTVSDHHRVGGPYIARPPHCGSAARN
eukprot:767206-Hanusia_phi.AAC.4